MEDPWGNNAWSAGDPVEVGHSSTESLGPPKWNTFERDADENTIDVGIPTWSGASGPSWGDGTNLWHTESSTLDVWKPSSNSDETVEGLGLQPEDAREQEENNKSDTRAVLPTPPLSPLPLSSTTPPLTGTPLQSLINPPSPDHFGSFESAEVISEESQDNYSWTPKASLFPSEATDEPWGATWGETEDERENERKSDEWESAQTTRRKRDRKVPPELLESLVRQWTEFATSLDPKLSTEDGEQASWRKGLDSIDGLAELVDSLLPVTSFPPPTPFNKTAVAKSVKETLRLTRSFPLTQSSPMAHLHASKGSTDWEKSVKAQKSAANDEWGWDLKTEPEEKQAATDLIRDKKSGGLLSFWSRKASSVPNAPVGDSPSANFPISPTVMSKPTSPTSTCPSIDSPRVVSPTTVTPPSPDGVDTAVADASSSQASAVSRFFNRFSRKPSAVATASSGQEKRTSLSLSFDDLSFLSDLTPSTTEDLLESPPEPASINSLGAMLSGLAKNSSPSSNKWFPPLGPPLLRSSHPAGHKATNSLGSDTSFDEKMADAQFMDLLNNSVGGGPSSSSGYAPVIVDFLESPEQTKTSLQASQFPDFSVQPAPTPLSSWLQSPVISPDRTRSSRNVPTVASAIPPIPPPHGLDGSSRHRQPIALARFHNPLPPTPKRGLDDLADFFPSSPHPGNGSPHPALLSQNDSLPSTILSTTTSILSSTSNHSSSVPASKTSSSIDFGDFGDFISTPIRRPSPPGDPLVTAKAIMHEPTVELVNKGAARQGRWPTPPSPVPPPLAPPPGPSSNLGYFNYPPMQQPSQLDLLTSDDSHDKSTSASRTFIPDQAATISQPVFVGPSSRPASTALGITPAPLPASPTYRTLSPLLAPKSVSSKPAGGSGLSAQDLSFFEGL